MEKYDKITELINELKAETFYKKSQQFYVGFFYRRDVVPNNLFNIM